MDNLIFPHGGNIFAVREKHGNDIIDFSANINPLGLPSRLKDELIKNFDRVLHYPDLRAERITRRIARYWGIDEENILPGNGSVELIYVLMSVLRPKSTLIAVPTFSEYERAAKTVRSKINFIGLEEKQGFTFRPGRFKEDVFFVCNPNNPTGNLVLQERPVTPEKMLVIDEAFMDFLPEEKNYTAVHRAVSCRKIIVLRTFTKFFALPGLRIGCLIAHKDIVRRLKAHLPPWNTNVLAQMAAERMLDDNAYIGKSRRLIAREREFLCKELAAIGALRSFPSVANFILLKIDRPGITAESVKAGLLKKGILIRDCSNFRGLDARYMRIAVRTRRENLKLIKALKEVT